MWFVEISDVQESSINCVLTSYPLALLNNVKLHDYSINHYILCSHTQIYDRSSHVARHNCGLLNGTVKINLIARSVSVKSVMCRMCDMSEVCHKCCMS